LKELKRQYFISRTKHTYPQPNAIERK